MARPSPEFSARLLRLLEEKGLNQREFARAVGITEPSATKYCRNGGVPEWDILLRIANYFAVSVDWLLTGSTDQKVCVGQDHPAIEAAPSWLIDLGPRLAALDATGQLAIKGAIEGILAPLETSQHNEQIKPPPQNAAAGPARARRR